MDTQNADQRSVDLVRNRENGGGKPALRHLLSSDKERSQEREDVLTCWGVRGWSEWRQRLNVGRTGRHSKMEKWLGSHLGAE